MPRSTVEIRGGWGQDAGNFSRDNANIFVMEVYPDRTYSLSIQRRESSGRYAELLFETGELPALPTEQTEEEATYEFELQTNHVTVDGHFAVDENENYRAYGSFTIDGRRKRFAGNIADASISDYYDFPITTSPTPTIRPLPTPDIYNIRPTMMMNVSPQTNFHPNISYITPIVYVTDVFPNAIHSTLTGGRRGDNISGTSGSDTIAGRGGDDRLSGRDGADTLEGGDGADRFIFHAPDLGRDRITDFSSQAGDRLVFSSENFPGLPRGVLDEAYFSVVSSAETSTSGFSWEYINNNLRAIERVESRFVYNEDDRVLYFQRNRFATVSNRSTNYEPQEITIASISYDIVQLNQPITASDILIVA